MRMGLGLCGAHRTGKTTLAQEYAKAAGIPFLVTSTSQVFKDLGLNPAAPMPFGTRLYVQTRILEVAESVWSQAEEWFVTDRTPIDMIAYTLADVTTGVCEGPEEVEQLLAYVDRCFDSLNRFFATVVLVQPGIEIVPDPTKPTGALSKGYLEHLNALMAGCMVDPRYRGKGFSMPRRITKMQARIAYLERACAVTHRALRDEALACTHH